MQPEVSGGSDSDSPPAHAHKPLSLELEDGPVSRAPSQDGLRLEGQKSASEEAGADSDQTAQDSPPQHAGLSLEKTVAVIEKMKGLVDSGRFETAVYERMALDIIKDYLASMEDSVKLIFVSYEIQDSELGRFLTPAMIEKLKKDIIDAIAQS